MSINSSNDIIDSRDIISEIDDLESAISDFNDDITTAEEEIDDLDSQIELLDDETELKFLIEATDDKKEQAKFESKIKNIQDAIIEYNDQIARITSERNEVMEELKPLKEFADECESYAPDWNSGVVLISEDHFTEYAKDLCEEVENVPDYIVIDWEETAENLKIDYTTIEFEGFSFYVR